MKLKAAREIFTGYEILLDDIGICVFEAGNDAMVAATDLDNYGVLGTIRVAHPDGGWKWDKVFQIQSWHSPCQMKQALDASRKLEGMDPPSARMIAREWKASQQADFDQGLILLAKLLHKKNLSKDELALLSSAGRRLNRAQTDLQAGSTSRVEAA
jgi:hypothetical protein